MKVLAIGALFAGLVALLGGLLSNDDGPPMCDDRVMRPGDTCRVTFDGSSDLVGYDEMLRRNETGLRDGLILGGIGLGGGTALLLGGRWLSRRAGP